MRTTHLLGFAEAAAASRLSAALAAVPGGAAEVQRISAVAVVTAALAPLPRLFGRRDRATMLARLARSQRLLEEAAIAGPFLPAAPNTVVVASDLAAMVEPRVPELIEALDCIGRLHQWDVTLRWQAETLLSAQRDRIAAEAAEAGGGRRALAAAVAAALGRARQERLEALRTAIGGFAHATLDLASASETEVGLTVLVERSGDGAIEAALGRLPAGLQAGASADLRGPMPPISFAAVGVRRVTARDIADAWRVLGLAEDGGAVSEEDVARAWRRTAARLHPDRAGSGATDLAALKTAAQLLRGLLRGAPVQTFEGLIARAGLGLVLPDLTPFRPKIEAVA